MFATLLRQERIGSHYARYSQTGEKQMIHTSESLQTKEKRMKDRHTSRVSN